VIKRITNYFIALLTFSVWPFKCQVSAAARALFSFNAQCRTVFSMSEKTDEHLMEKLCPIHLLKVTEIERK